MFKNEKEFKEIVSELKVRLGLNARILIDLVPNMEKIVGKYEPLEQLPPNESENRFKRCFLTF